MINDSDFGGKVDLCRGRNALFITGIPVRWEWGIGGYSGRRKGGNGSDGMCEWRGRNKLGEVINEVEKCGARGRVRESWREKIYMYIYN